MAERKDSKGQILKTGESERKDGRYHFAYTDITGKRCYIYGKDLDELRRKESLYYIPTLNGTDPCDDNATVNDIYDKALSLKFGIKESTYASYRQSYDNHVGNTLGKRLIKTVRYSDIVDLYARLARSGLSAKTIQHVHTQVKSAFGLAYRDQTIPYDPTEGVRAVLRCAAGARERKIRALTEEEMRIFLDFIKDHPVYGRYHSIFVVMIGTGLRVGELCGLRWQDVDIENRVIDINHGIVLLRAIKGIRKEQLAISTPKTESGKRRIPIMKPVADAFGEEYLWANSRGFKSTTIDGYTGFVFTNLNGNVYTSIRLDLALKCIVTAYYKKEEADAAKEERPARLLPHISNHMLRHTFCSRLCENDTNLKVIQTLMGHANANITLDIYSEVSREKQLAVIDKLADRLDVF